MTDWKRPWEFEVPDSSISMADYMLAYDVRANLTNAGLNFLTKTPDAEFVDPDTYLEALITSAFGIVTNPYTQKYAPPGWSPVKAAFAVWNRALNFMKTIPVNAGDPNTLSVFDAWIAKTGYLYGGHLAIPAVLPTGDGINKASGPDAVQSGTIFGGNK